APPTCYHKPPIGSDAMSYLGRIPFGPRAAEPGFRGWQLGAQPAPPSPSTAPSCSVRPRAPGVLASTGTANSPPSPYRQDESRDRSPPLRWTGGYQSLSSADPVATAPRL